MVVDDKILSCIRQAARKYPEITKVLLFGSRARGDNQKRSDYDLAVFTQEQPLRQYLSFCNDIDEIDTLYKFDLVLVDEHTNKKLLQNILKDGVVIYG